MPPLVKTHPVSTFKKLPDANGKTGRFEAMVSVFGNVDMQQDRVVPSAFQKSISTWRSKGDPIPIIWSHQWDDPFAHIGWADPNEVEEVQPNQKAGTNGGLLVRGQIDIDKEFAKQVYDLMDERRVKEWSFAYDVIREKRASDGANDLLELGIIEAGPTLKGANPLVETLGVKTAAYFGRLADQEKRRVTEEEAQLIALAKRADDFGDRRLMRVVRAQLEQLAKVATKPWRIIGRDGQYCVVKEDSEEPLKCYDNEAEAQAYMRALYANEPGAGKGQKAGDPSALIEWFNNGADGQIDWGSEGDWDQCVSVASEHMDEDQAQGFCQLRHMDATGMTTAEHHAQKERKPTGRKADVDRSSWDGQAAITACLNSEDPAAAFAKVCAGRKNGDPALAQSWALPHHSRPGAPPNERGVSSALGRANQTEGLVNKAAAVAHLERHQEMIQRLNESKAKAGRVIGSQRVADLKARIAEAVDSWADEVNTGGTIEGEVTGTKHQPDPIERASDKEARVATVHAKMALVEEMLASGKE